MRNKIIFVLLLFVTQLSAQTNREIKGSVTDQVTGEPLLGVSVLLKGTTQGTVTDMSGAFSINVPASVNNLILKFSYLGYLTSEVHIQESNVVSVTMSEDIEKLEEVVVVGYGTQKRVNMTGSVSSMKSGEVKTLPIANISNALGGRVSGLVTQQASGEPGNDKSILYLRGNKDPLVLVDGIETEYNKVNMEEVETITMLKDASAVAPYGLRGANGVILITTKRGQAGKVTLTYNGEFGWQKPTNTPEFMNSADSKRLQKKAYEMDGNLAAADAITDEMLANYELGIDAYPNTDWVKNYMQTSNSQKHNITINGGNELLKAYIVMGYLNQGSMYGKNQGYERFNLRSNLDFQITPITKFTTDISITGDEKKAHAANSDAIMLNIYRARPFEADVYSNGLPAEQASIGGSMYQTVHAGGEQSHKNNYQTITLSLNQELPFVKGLSVKALFNVDRQTYDYKVWNVPYTSYVYDAVNNIYNEKTTSFAASLKQGNRIYMYYTAQGYINYANQFDNHGLTGMLVYERRWGGKPSDFYGQRTNYSVLIPELDMGPSGNQYNGGTSSQMAQDGIVLRFNYDYKQKYMLEIAGRYDRAYKYAPNQRSDFFPSASAGWRISEENFMKDISGLDNLKLRVSYGKSGNPVGEPFSYMSSYDVTTGYVWGTSQTPQQGLSESEEPNPYLTWETVWKANAGFDLSLWKGLLGVEFDVFRDYRKDKIISQNNIVSSEYGIKPAQANGGEEERYGIDISLTNTTRINKDFKINNNIVFGFSRDKQLKIDEAMGTYSIPQWRRTGYSESQLRGYVADGLFKDEEDIANSPFINASVKPGDIKYKDLNGDGKIDSQDQTIIGRTRIPEIMYGYTLAIGYRNFDMSLFLQGTGNSDFYLGQDASGGSDRGVRFPFANEKPRKDHINSWTTDNPDPNAKYPRLSSTSRDWNYYTSSFWVVNTAYLKVKSLELGYNFNQKLTRKAFIDKARIYLNFYNLWTLYSNMPKDFDVENQNYNVYPQQFITSLGINITF